ncbi:MAG: response regulator [Rhodobacteraceae bacterium]|nr:response regulator [Paracoccaceae bacterium]
MRSEYRNRMTGQNDLTPDPGTQSQVRVLVVDDSLGFQDRINAVLMADGRFCITGFASSALDARAMMVKEPPDVLTLDMDMPGMDGLEFLRRIMRLRPMPVVMLSGMTDRSGDLATQAMREGARDWLGKIQASFAPGPEGLADRLVAAARSWPYGRHGLPLVPIARLTGQKPSARWNGRLVLVGASTGGVEALEKLLGALGTNGPPVLVTQHMPPKFLERMAARLERQLGQPMTIARQGQRAVPGGTYFAPGGDRHLGIISHGHEVRLCVSDALFGRSSSIAHMFTSALPVANKVVAVLLSGMGDDGAEALLSLRKAGAQCLVQDKESSAIFGMPGAAMRIGAAEKALRPEAIAAEILAKTLP